MPTVSAGSNVSVHIAEVRAFLTAYYGSDGPNGQELMEPLRTITARHRLGLVTVHGVDYQIVDIGLRMLQPHELLRAQFGRFAADYDLSAATTKRDQIRLIGNSAPPEVVEAIVRANVASGKAVAA
jgi:DNA (cytosine-5)-methyltransferase 1